MVDIAIIGTAFELQGTDNFGELWDNIAHGRVKTKYNLLNISSSEFKLEDFDLEEIKKFSPKLFKYTPEQVKKWTLNIEGY